jgi:sulfur relay (sulfurtransferase) complex TusBCD TusD component (DsrE family)
MPGTVLLATRNGLGVVSEADSEFGLEMFDKLLHTIEAAGVLPSAICFYTEGVRLVARESPVVLGLKLLQAQGVRLLVCETCLRRFGLIDQVAVGEVGGMAMIAPLLLNADKVITL